MADDDNATRASDSDCVNLNDGRIGGWAEKLGVSEIELQAAVEKVGHKVGDVRAFLKID